MKSYLLAIATLCFISTGFYLPIHSQDDYLKQSTSDSIDTSSSKSKKLLLPIESLVNLLEQKRYKIESELEISATKGGLSYTILVNTKTIVESPKFVSEIDFISKNGTIGKQYKVVSDGKTTWIYHLDEKIYSVSNYQDFIDSNDDFLLGFINSLVLDMKKDINFTSGINDFSELSKSQKMDYIYDLLDEKNLDINSINFKNDFIQGKYYEVIEFFIPKDKINFSVFVDPETLNIKALHFSGEQDDMMFDFKEQVIRQTIPMSSYTFRFIPPLGVKKVEEQISIDP